jgi:hypothetical protein
MREHVFGLLALKRKRRMGSKPHIERKFMCNNG